MSAPRLRRFRVLHIETNVYAIIVKARDKKHAEEEADLIYEGSSFERWDCINGWTDLEVEEITETGAKR